MANTSLIIETQIFDYRKLNESAGQDKSLVVSGVVQRKGAKNQNGRIYPDSILEREVKKYQQLIKERRAMGELDHPESAIVSLKNVSHNIVDLQWEGDELIGKIEILNTPNGNILRNLLESNIRVGVSSRGTGTLKKVNENSSMVGEDFDLIAFDFVSNPSVVGAFATPLHEGKISGPATRIVNNDNVSSDDAYDSLKSRMMRAAGISPAKKEIVKETKELNLLQKRAGIISESTPPSKKNVVSELLTADYNKDRADEYNELAAVQDKVNELYPEATTFLINGAVQIVFPGFDGFIRHLVPKSNSYDFVGKWNEQDFSDENQTLDQIIQLIDLPYNKVFNGGDATTDVEDADSTSDEKDSEQSEDDNFITIDDVNEILLELTKENDAKERVVAYLRESVGGKEKLHEALPPGFRQDHPRLLKKIEKTFPNDKIKQIQHAWKIFGDMAKASTVVPEGQHGRAAQLAGAIQGFDGSDFEELEEGFLDDMKDSFRKGYEKQMSKKPKQEPKSSVKESGKVGEPDVWDIDAEQDPNKPTDPRKHFDMLTPKYRAQKEKELLQKNARKYLDQELFNARLRAANSERERIRDLKAFDPIIESENVEEIDWEALKVQLANGIRVEIENTDDPAKALQIAMDNLHKDPEYYSKLAQTELAEEISREEAKRDQTGRKKDLSRLKNPFGEDPLGTLERNNIGRGKNKSHKGLRR